MTEQKIKILYADDEQNNLISFKAMFRKDYEVLTAGNEETIWEVLSGHPDLHIVVLDQRMPKKTGVALFEEIVQHYPMPVRMLCTGYSDIEAVIDAINKGKVFRYIQKPWSEADVRSAIEEGQKYYEATALLAETNAELLKANTELERFSHTVTHELRTPIMSVLGATSIAQDTQSIKEVKDMLSIVNKTMLKLDAFIYNIQDYYTIKNGELQIGAINFDKLIHDLHDMYEINSRTAGVRFDVRLNCKDAFHSDETLLTIILNNLVSNAFKYQRKEERGKFVELSVHTDNGLAQVIVSDNGTGIEHEMLDNIFKMFYRATTQEHGSGFGLYNVQDALKKLKGKISVSSEKNKGSRFTLEIPDMRAIDISQ